jgi:hypothetical protein
MFIRIIGFIELHYNQTKIIMFFSNILHINIDINYVDTWLEK